MTCVIVESNHRQLIKIEFTRIPLPETIDRNHMKIRLISCNWQEPINRLQLWKTTLVKKKYCPEVPSCKE